MKKTILILFLIAGCYNGKKVNMTIKRTTTTTRTVEIRIDTTKNISDTIKK